MPKFLPRILCYLWVAILAFFILISVRTSYRRSLPTEEFAYACDRFGYLQMAKEIRHAFAQGVWPDFQLESPQTRQLIDLMQQHKVPLSRWEEAVAPHAHHYFPRSRYVGVQYPPGTGLVLSIFPQGEAVYGLNRVVVFVYLVVGIAVLVIALWKRAWASIGLPILALSLGMMVLTRIAADTFSINAVLVPILFTCCLSLLALRFRTGGRNNLGFFCALFAGLCFGFATLIRLPSLLMLPGFLVLLWPDRLRFKTFPIALVVGLTLTGIIPVLVNQQEVAGAWYLPTYADVDAAVPTLDTLKSNFHFFLGNGPGALDNWALLYALLGFCGFLIFHARNASEAKSNRLQLSWKRLTISVALIWLISIWFFLTHAVTGAHYMIPAVLATATLVGFGAFGIECTSRTARINLRQVLSWVALVLILLPGFGIFIRVWPTRSQADEPVRANTHTPILLPAELMDDKVWIWADLLTGTLWYYDNKPAFKFKSTDEEVRTMMFRYIFERGDRQYVIQDSEEIKQYMDEITRLGGKLEVRGKVNGQPYFLIVWPESGPGSAQAMG
jgi:hypothetical protein